MGSVTQKVVRVEMDDGTPTAIEWGGERFLVTDTPTELADLLYALTHPPTVVGWRFQGTAEGGQSRIFDVVLGRSGWELARVFD